MPGSQTVDVRIRFVGRERELQRLRTQFARGGALSLVGPGGVGKSRLAFEASLRYARSTGHRNFYVALAGVTPEAVEGAILAAAGIRERIGHPPLDTLREELAVQPTLLVLDNCEHVDAKARHIISALLDVPNLSIVATSRRKLEYRDETVLDLAPFNTDEGVEFLMARARSANIRIEQHDLDFARTIVSRLDGLPVAIDLAAARLASLSLRELATELEELRPYQFRSSRGTDPRHHTISKVVDWSCSRLDAGAQRIFALSSLFSDAFRPDDVAALLNGDASRISSTDILSQLASNSLLVPCGINRFTMLSPIRAVAARGLATQQDRRAVDERFAKRMNAVAVQLRERIESPDAQDSPAELFDRYDDLCSALEWALKDPAQRLPDVIDIATTLVFVWGDGGRLREGRAWTERLVTSSEHISPILRGRIHYAAMRVAHSAGDMERVLTLGTAGVSAFMIAGERLGLARVYNALSVASLFSGRLEDAETYVETAISLYEAIGFDRGVAAALANYGNVALEGRCDPVIAREHYERSLEIVLRTGPDSLVGVIYGDLAEATYFLHDMPTAESYARLAIARFTRAKNDLMTAWQHQTIARTQMARGDISGAGRSLRHCLELLDDSNQPNYLALAAEALSRLLSMQQQYDRAWLATCAAQRVREQHRLPRTGPAAKEVRAEEDRLARLLGPAESAAIAAQAGRLDLGRLPALLLRLLSEEPI